MPNASITYATTVWRCTGTIPKFCCNTYPATTSSCSSSNKCGAPQPLPIGTATPNVSLRMIHRLNVCLGIEIFTSKKKSMISCCVSIFLSYRRDAIFPTRFRTTTGNPHVLLILFEFFLFFLYLSFAFIFDPCPIFNYLRGILKRKGKEKKKKKKKKII